MVYGFFIIKFIYDYNKSFSKRTYTNRGNNGLIITDQNQISRPTEKLKELVKDITDEYIADPNIKKKYKSSSDYIEEKIGNNKEQLAQAIAYHHEYLSSLDNNK